MATPLGAETAELIIVRPESPAPTARLDWEPEAPSLPPPKPEKLPFYRRLRFRAAPGRRAREAEEADGRNAKATVK